MPRSKHRRKPGGEPWPIPDEASRGSSSACPGSTSWRPDRAPPGCRYSTGPIRWRLRRWTERWLKLAWLPGAVEVAEQGSAGPEGWLQLRIHIGQRHPLDHTARSSGSVADEEEAAHQADGLRKKGHGYSTVVQATCALEQPP